MRKIVLISILLFSFQYACSAAEIKFVTEDYPPFEYQQDGEAKGFTIEVIKELLKRSGHKGSFGFYPWKRAEQMSHEDENTVIHTITRNEKRESLYKWLGPVTPREAYFFKLKDRKDIQINSLEDAKKYRIAVIRGHAITDYLLSKGFEEDKNLHIVSGAKQRLLLLLNGRVDLIENLEHVMYWRLELFKKDEDFSSFNLDKSMLKKSFLIDGSKQYYLGFNKKTSDEIVNDFRAAFESMKQDGSLKKIKSKYFSVDE